MKKKIKLNVGYEDFCEWYFDEDTSDSVVNELIQKGVVSIQCIANDVGYLPTRLIRNPKAIDRDDLEDSELYASDEDWLEDGEICEYHLKNKYEVVLVRK